MIPNRVKNLFVFIDYLHSKIEHYQSFGGLFSELESLGNNRRNLIPNNYFDKKKLDEINSEIKNKFEVINSEIIQPIKQKATELNICNPEKIETLWNNNISEIENLHNEVNENEVKHIVNQKDKYLHFRLNAPRNLFTQNDFAPEFFDELDEILKELFKDFDEYKKNEFDSLPLNSVEVNLTTFFLKDLKNLEVKTPKQPEKLKPELNQALISFKSTEIIESLHCELKGYFQGKEAELKKALQGEQLTEFLLFPNNQNKFVEVFKRLKYNGLLLSKPKEIKEWICSTFTYQYQKGNKKEVRNFNALTVHDTLTKDKGEPTKNERICVVEWLPYKSHLLRQREAEKESI